MKSIKYPFFVSREAGITIKNNWTAKNFSSSFEDFGFRFGFLNGLFLCERGNDDQRINETESFIDCILDDESRKIIKDKFEVFIPFPIIMEKAIKNEVAFGVFCKKQDTHEFEIFIDKFIYDDKENDITPGCVIDVMNQMAKNIVIKDKYEREGFLVFSDEFQCELHIEKDSNIKKFESKLGGYYNSNLYENIMFSLCNYYYNCRMEKIKTEPFLSFMGIGFIRTDYMEDQFTNVFPNDFSLGIRSDFRELIRKDTYQFNFNPRRIKMNKNIKEMLQKKIGVNGASLIIPHQNCGIRIRKKTDEYYSSVEICCTANLEHIEFERGNWFPNLKLNSEKTETVFSTTKRTIKIKNLYDSFPKLLKNIEECMKEAISEYKKNSESHRFFRVEEPIELDHFMGRVKKNFNEIIWKNYFVSYPSYSEYHGSDQRFYSHDVFVMRDENSENFQIFTSSEINGDVEGVTLSSSVTDNFKTVYIENHRSSTMSMIATNPAIINHLDFRISDNYGNQAPILGFNNSGLNENQYYISVMRHNIKMGLVGFRFTINDDDKKVIIDLIEIGFDRIIFDQIREGSIDLSDPDEVKSIKDFTYAIKIRVFNKKTLKIKKRDIIQIMEYVNRSSSNDMPFIEAYRSTDPQCIKVLTALGIFEYRKKQDDDYRYLVDLSNTLWKKSIKSFYISKKEFDMCSKFKSFDKAFEFALKNNVGNGITKSIKNIDFGDIEIEQDDLSFYVGYSDHIHMVAFPKKSIVKKMIDKYRPFIERASDKYNHIIRLYKTLDIKKICLKREYEVKINRPLTKKKLLCTFKEAQKKALEKIKSDLRFIKKSSITEKVIEKFANEFGDKIKLSLKDSLAAGNCEPASKSFAKKYLNVSDETETRTLKELFKVRQHDKYHVDRIITKLIDETEEFIYE